jgi:hypothetical protein
MVPERLHNAWEAVRVLTIARYELAVFPDIFIETDGLSLKIMHNHVRVLAEISF